MITRKHGPANWIIEHADTMVKTTEQRNQKIQSKLSWGQHKTFLKTLSKSHNFVTSIIFFNSMKVWACTWLVLCCLLNEQKVLIIEPW